MASNGHHRSSAFMYMNEGSARLRAPAFLSSVITSDERYLSYNTNDTEIKLEYL